METPPDEYLTRGKRFHQMLRVGVCCMDITMRRSTILTNICVDAKSSISTWYFANYTRLGTESTQDKVSSYRCDQTQYLTTTFHSYCKQEPLRKLLTLLEMSKNGKHSQYYSLHVPFVPFSPRSFSADFKGVFLKQVGSRSWLHGRRSHRSWGDMTPTCRSKGDKGDIIWG